MQRERKTVARKKRKREQKARRPQLQPHEKHWKERMFRRGMREAHEYYARRQQQARVITLALWKSTRPVKTIRDIVLTRAGFVTNKKNQMIGVIGRSAYLPTHEITYAYYPQPEESSIFAAGIPGTRTGGDTERFPGSVGVLVCNQPPAEPGKPTEWRIRVLQGSTIKKANPRLTKKVQSKYFHWRETLLTHFFEHAAQNKVSRVSFYLSGGKENERLFRTAAARGYADIEVGPVAATREHSHEYSYLTAYNPKMGENGQ